MFAVPLSNPSQKTDRESNCIRLADAYSWETYAGLHRFRCVPAYRMLLLRLGIAFSVVYLDCSVVHLLNVRYIDVRKSFAQQYSVSLGYIYQEK